jgi:MscS family membrane protein
VGIELVGGHLEANGQSQAVQLLPPGRKTLKALIFVMALLVTLDNFGFNVTALLAGLGVGGIAVALAAQKTLENFFGGITIYADRPVRVGDFCRFGDKIGTVEEIGLRSTRVRTLDRTVVSVPNAEFSSLQLENFSKRDRIWYHPSIGLRYETTPDQLRFVLVEIRRMLYAHPKVDPDPARIRFESFGAYSLNLEIFAYVSVTDYGEFLEVAEDLNLRIMDIVEQAGTGFAFPSQTTYLEQGEPLSDESRQQIEERVAKWRDENALFLPRFPREEIEELRNSIDYPVKGAPKLNGAGERDERRA